MHRKKPGEPGRIVVLRSASDQRARTPTKICDITFETLPVEHSILAPAVGYRVNAGRARIFYAPDVIYIHERSAALKVVQINIGDGAL